MKELFSEVKETVVDYDLEGNASRLETLQEKFSGEQTRAVARDDFGPEFAENEIRLAAVNAEQVDNTFLREQHAGMKPDLEHAGMMKHTYEENAELWARVLGGESTEKDKEMLGGYIENNRKRLDEEVARGHEFGFDRLKETSDDPSSVDDLIEYAKRTDQYETGNRDTERANREPVDQERSDEDRQKEANRSIAFSKEEFSRALGFEMPFQRLELGDDIRLRETLAKRLGEIRKTMTRERGADFREQKQRFAPQVRSLFEEFAPSSQARDKIRRDFERGMEDPRARARKEQEERVNRARQRNRTDRNHRTGR
ncbi:MAG: hypothetical protein Q8Q11_00655 [bacterium]|nr:hypothetical protein [bacterium]MDZ4247827.1 hypothetical protein [Patescibacteria group bacterium]